MPFALQPNLGNLNKTYHELFNKIKHKVDRFIFLVSQKQSTTKWRLKYDNLGKGPHGLSKEEE